MLSNLRQKIILSLAFAALVYFVLTLYADAPKLAEAFLRWDWRYLPLALGATFGNYLLRFARWQYYLRVISIRGVGRGASFLIFLSGFSLTMVPGKLGELLKSVLLKARYGTPVSYSASIVGAERLTDVLGMVFLVAIGLSVYPFGLTAIAILLLGIIAFIALLQSRTLAERGLDLLAQVPLIGRFAPLARNLYESAYLLLRARPLMIAIALAVAAWFGECLAFFLILLGFGYAPMPTLLLQATFIYAGSSLFGAATLLPGGLGATEGSMTSLTQVLIRASAPVAAAATLLVRVCTLWFAVGLGVVALILFGLPKDAVE